MTFKKHSRTSLLCLIIIATTLIGGIAEGMSLIFVGPIYINSLFLTIIATVPVLSNYYHDKHLKDNAKYLHACNQKYVKWAKFDKQSLITKSLYFFLTPVFIICCISIPFAFGVNLNDQLWVFILMLAVGVIYLVVPPIVQLIFYKKEKYHEFILKVALPYHALLSVIGGFVAIYGAIFKNTGATVHVLLMFLALISYIAVFSVSKFYTPLAGIVVRGVDWASRVVYKHQRKHIEISHKQDSLTLQEKFFNIFTPKRFRKS